MSSLQHTDVTTLARIVGSTPTLKVVEVRNARTVIKARIDISGTRGSVVGPHSVVDQRVTEEKVQLNPVFVKLKNKFSERPSLRNYN